jgi:hypothetical protein
MFDLMSCGRKSRLAMAATLFCMTVSIAAQAQYSTLSAAQYPAPAPGQYAPPPPAMAPQQLDQLVGRIALYPDPLLAQTLTAATFWADIPAAASWADQHRTLKGDALAQAIQADQLPWDPSVLGLLAFPETLDMMARDPDWTQELGDAVLTQRPEVMDAVQRDRAQAYNYGYLRPNQYENVVYAGGYYAITPLDPAFYYVPVYDPAIVFFPPRPGFVVTGAIHFGPRIVIGAGFVSAGFWAGPSIVWASHGIFIGGALWGRTWYNRGVYVHGYAGAYAAHGYVRPVGPRIEQHPVHREERRPPR